MHWRCDGQNMQQFRFLLSFEELCKRSVGVLELDSQRKWSPWESGGGLMPGQWGSML